LPRNEALTPPPRFPDVPPLPAEPAGSGPSAVEGAAPDSILDTLRHLDRGAHSPTAAPEVMGGGGGSGPSIG